ncbi:MAG: flagellar biosynthesis anti-sigma factor FlgM [Rhodoferax sp.]
MTDAISQYAQLAASDPYVRKPTEKVGKTSATGVATEAQATLAGAAAPAVAPAHGDDVLSLSKVAERIKQEPDFDRAKVEAIKQAIHSGQYPLNTKRIAESFVAIEQMIGK